MSAVLSIFSWYNVISPHSCCDTSVTLNYWPQDSANPKIKHQRKTHN